MTDAPRDHGRAGAVGFAEVRPALALFAEAIAGRPLSLEPLEAPTADGPAPQVLFDGQTIHLPAEVGDFSSARHNRSAYRMMVLHQVGYLQFGTFRYEWAGGPPADPPVPPATATAALERFFAAAPDPSLLRRVFVAVEDLRIDTAIRARYPGARADLDRVLAHARAGRPSPDGLEARRWLLEALVRYSLGASRPALIDEDPTGRCRRVLDAAGVVERAEATVDDSADAASTICALLRGRLVAVASDTADDDTTLVAPDEPRAEESSDPSGWMLDDADGEATPSDVDLDAGDVDFRGELRPDLVYRRSAAAGGAVPEDLLAGAASGPGDPDAPTAAVTTGRASSPPSARSGADRTFLYDEWDYRANRYLPAWCRLSEQRLRGDDFAFIGAVRRRHAVLASQVRRRFRFVRPEAWHRVHRTSDGDDFELDAVIDAVVSRRAGHLTDDRLYMRRDRARREVATAFLVDLSASTGSPLADPDAPHPALVPHPDTLEYPYLSADEEERARQAGEPARRILDIAKESLALMCDALQVLGDEHAVYGFSGFGRHQVEFFVAKDFDDEPSPRTWAALAAMEPRRYTRMGPAIRHATAKLAAEPVRTKLLIVMSDGYPQDSDYGPEPGDKEYGVQDTGRALREAETAGVSTFCVTIDPAGNDYLRRMCPEHRYAVIDDVHALPGELAKLYRSLTTFSPRRLRV